jgi:hypothetical protein
VAQLQNVLRPSTSVHCRGRWAARSLPFTFSDDHSLVTITRIIIDDIINIHPGQGPLAALAHEVDTAQVRVLIGCVFVEIVIESETCHICRAVLLTI